MGYATDNASQVPEADGTDPYLWAVGLGGTSNSRPGGTFNPRLIPISLSGQMPRTYKQSGNLSLAETRGGIITSTSPSTVTWVIQTFYQLAYTRDPALPRELGYLLQRGWTGTLIVNKAQYWGEVASSAAMTALSSALTGDWCQRSDQGHQVFLLTGASFSVSGNWTAVLFSDLKRPRIQWGAVANSSAMVALSNAQVGDRCTRTDDSGNTYQLMGTASGPNYYATSANWVLQSAAWTPGIEVNWNNLDPSTLAQDHPELWLKSKGVDSWVAS